MPANTDPTSPDRAPRRSDALSTLASLLFIAWCFMVGTLLLYAPWMPVWARLTASFSDPSLQQILAHPTLRGAICGFGLFHLVWGTHDLDGLIARFLRRRLDAVEAEEQQAGEEGRGEEGTGEPETRGHQTEAGDTGEPYAAEDEAGAGEPSAAAAGADGRPAAAHPEER